MGDTKGSSTGPLAGPHGLRPEAHMAARLPASRPQPHFLLCKQGSENFHSPGNIRDCKVTGQSPGNFSHYIRQVRGQSLEEKSMSSISVWPGNHLLRHVHSDSHFFLVIFLLYRTIPSLNYSTTIICVVIKKNYRSELPPALEEEGRDRCWAAESSY